MLLMACPWKDPFWFLSFSLFLSLSLFLFSLFFPLSPSPLFLFSSLCTPQLFLLTQRPNVLSWRAMDPEWNERESSKCRREESKKERRRKEEKEEERENPCGSSFFSLWFLRERIVWKRKKNPPLFLYTGPFSVTGFLPLPLSLSLAFIFCPFLKATQRGRCPFFFLPLSLSLSLSNLLSPFFFFLSLLESLFSKPPDFFSFLSWPLKEEPRAGYRVRGGKKEVFRGKETEKGGKRRKTEKIRKREEV